MFIICELCLLLNTYTLNSFNFTLIYLQIKFNNISKANIFSSMYSVLPIWLKYLSTWYLWPNLYGIQVRVGKMDNKEKKNKFSICFKNLFPDYYFKVLCYILENRNDGNTSKLSEYIDSLESSQPASKMMVYLKNIKLYIIFKY